MEKENFEAIYRLITADICDAYCGIKESPHMEDFYQGKILGLHFALNVAANWGFKEAYDEVNAMW